MEERFVFGPVPSRRLGQSLGLSPIPSKTCNYACVYCQLGRTAHMTNTPQRFFEPEEMLAEFRAYLEHGGQFDVVTIVGEGEPTLYQGLGELIQGVKRLTDKPVAVITNGALLSDEAVSGRLLQADIVLPSVDAYDEQSFRKLDRPFGRLSYDEVTDGLRRFSHLFQGQLWLELMLVKGYNCTEEALDRFEALLSTLRYDRLYLNTPVRPPAEADAQPPSQAFLQKAVERLGGISIDMLTTGAFSSDLADDYQAALSIIRRHPMNQHEVESLISSRGGDAGAILRRLQEDAQLEAVTYKGYTTYRFR